MRPLLLDNYDSFTFNLYQLVAGISGREPIVFANDQLTWEEFCALDIDSVIVSPGPGHPDRDRDFGICRQVLQCSSLPILGVCLGHQGIGSAFGGKVVKAPEPVHGRTSRVYHDESEVFAGIPQGFLAVRYHSLMVTRPLPPSIRETAWSEDGVVMGLAHRTRPLWGVQFHPESIGTEYGRRLLENFNAFVAGQNGEPRPARASVACLPQQRSLPSARAVTDWRVSVRRVERCPDPEAVFRTLFATDSNAFWLDSSRPHAETARFSFMGGSRGPYAELITYSTRTRRVRVRDRHGESDLAGPLFPFLNERLAARACAAPDLPFDFVGGLVGYFGYELKAECGARARHRSALPDCALVFADRVIVFDHVERVLYLLCVTPMQDRDASAAWLDATERVLATVCGAQPIEDVAAGPSTPSITMPCMTFIPDQSRAQYLHSIRKCLQHLGEGESYEICLTTQLRSPTQVDPFEYYAVLRRRNAAPYAAFLRMGGASIASSSPERFLRIRPDGTVESRPIKGTAPRFANAVEDAAAREQLRTESKSRSENLMIVDLLRNDLGRACGVGSVHVPELMAVESYATVHQLVSTIRGHLKPEVTAVDCLQAAFPGGSMTGAPKLRTMALIDALEPAPRGVYSGAIGYLSLNGAADLNIVIRTAVFHGGAVSIGTGGAIVALSDASEEFEEVLLKARALVDTFGAVGARATIDVGERPSVPSSSGAA